MWREGGQCLETFPLSPSMESLTSASDLQLNQVHSTRLVFPGVDFKVGGGGGVQVFRCCCLFYLLEVGSECCVEKETTKIIKGVYVVGWTYFKEK